MEAVIGMDGKEQDWRQGNQLSVSSVVLLSSPSTIARDICTRPPSLLMASCVSVEGMLWLQERA